MRFQVPQFTDVETKLVGPLSLRQFLWIGGGGFLVFLVNFFVQGTVLIVFGVIIMSTAIAMAYAKVAGVSLPVYLGLGIVYFFGPKEYTYDSETQQDGQK